MTTKPCDTLALSGRGWLGAEGVDLLALDRGEVSRLGAVDADHGTGQVVDSLRTRPLRRLEPAAVPDTIGQAGGVRLDAVGEPLDADDALEVADRFPAQTAQQPQHTVLREVLHVVGFGVEGGLVAVIAHRSAHGDTGVDATAGEDVHGGQVLGEPERVLQTERDDGGAEFDARRPLARGRHDRHRRRDPGLQVAAPEPHTVEAESLGPLDHLERLFDTRPGIGVVEPADGQEPELAQRFSTSGHLMVSVSTAVIAAVNR